MVSPWKTFGGFKGTYAWETWSLEKRSMLKCGISVNFLPIKKLNTGSDTVKFPNALQGSQCFVLRFACQCWSALMTHDVTTKNKLAVFLYATCPPRKAFLDRQGICWGILTVHGYHKAVEGSKARSLFMWSCLSFVADSIFASHFLASYFMSFL